VTEKEDPQALLRRIAELEMQLAESKRGSPKHLSKASGFWQTNSRLVDLIEKFNGGPIALDPCSAPNNPTRAKTFWHPPKHDGLKLTWHLPGTRAGLVYVNPPFAGAREWSSKAVEESHPRGAHRIEIIVLLPPRTETLFFR